MATAGVSDSSTMTGSGGRTSGSGSGGGGGGGAGGAGGPSPNSSGSGGGGASPVGAASSGRSWGSSSGAVSVRLPALRATLASFGWGGGGGGGGGLADSGSGGGAWKVTSMGSGRDARTKRLRVIMTTMARITHTPSDVPHEANQRFFADASFCSSKPSNIRRSLAGLGYSCVTTT